MAIENSIHLICKSPDGDKTPISFATDTAMSCPNRGRYQTTRGPISSCALRDGGECVFTASCGTWLVEKITEQGGQLGIYFTKVIQNKSCIYF